MCLAALNVTADQGTCKTKLWNLLLVGNVLTMEHSWLDCSQWHDAFRKQRLLPDALNLVGTAERRRTCRASHQVWEEQLQEFLSLHFARPVCKCVRVTTAWLVSTLRIVEGNRQYANMWPRHGSSARWGLWRVTASMLNCREDLTSGGTATWRPGEGPTTPYRKNKLACNEMDFDRLFGKTWAMGKMHRICNFGMWVPLGRQLWMGW
jgi:hypothetical protein